MDIEVKTPACVYLLVSLSQCQVYALTRIVCALDTCDAGSLGILILHVDARLRLRR